MKNTLKAREAQFASRLQKPSFKDPKLVMGILLIAVSIIAVALVLKVGNQTKPYYAAAHDIEVGQKISTSDLKLVDAQLAEAGDFYVAGDQQMQEGVYATRHISGGQLLGSADVSERPEDGRREVVISLDTSVAAALKPSDRVDIWVSEQKENSRDYEDPHAVMLGAEIAGKNSEESLIGGTGKTAVSVLVVEDSLQDVLDAVNNEAKINLIPSNYSSMKDNAGGKSDG